MPPPSWVELQTSAWSTDCSGSSTDWAEVCGDEVGPASHDHGGHDHGGVGEAGSGEASSGEASPGGTSLTFTIPPGGSSDSAMVIASLAQVPHSHKPNPNPKPKFQTHTPPNPTQTQCPKSCHYVDLKMPANENALTQPTFELGICGIIQDVFQGDYTTEQKFEKLLEKY